MSAPREEPLKFDFDFDEAIERVAQTDPAEVASAQLATVPDATIDSLIDAFEACANHTPSGGEFWYARDLQVLLQYRRWESFEDVLARAVTACAQAGHDPDDHFRETTKMVTVGSGAEREISDVMMDRYACYLVAQNGDPKKRPIAFAQTYFAIQTRRRELADRAVAVPMTEDEKRGLSQRADQGAQPLSIERREGGGGHNAPGLLDLPQHGLPGPVREERGTDQAAQGFAQQRRYSRSNG